MKREKEIRMRRLEVSQALSRWAEVAKKLKEKYGTEHLPPVYSLTQLYRNALGMSLELLNWVLGEGSSVILDKRMLVVENFKRALEGGRPKPGWSGKFPKIDKDFKEFMEVMRKIAEDKKKYLEINWDDLESKD